MAWVAAAAACIGSPAGCPVNLRFLIEGEEETGSQSLPRLPEAAPRPARRGRRRALRHLQLRDRRAGAHLAAARARAGGRRGHLPRPAGPQRRLRRRRARRGADPVPPARRAARAGRPDRRARALPRTWCKPSAAVRRRLARLPFSEAAFRRGAGMLPGTRLERERGASVYEQLWTRPSLTVIAIEAHPLHGAANQILDSARARISMRTVPNMDPGRSGRAADPQAHAKPPAGAHVEARITRTTPWWTSDPDGAGRRGGAAGARARLRQEARAHRLRRVDRLRQAVRRRARRALPADGRRGPRLRRALRGREPAPRRLEEVDALGGLPVRRARAARPRRARARGPAACRRPQAAAFERPQAPAMIPLLVVLGLVPLDPAPAAAERRGKAFWKALAAECAVPAGETASGLVSEAVSLLGSPDSEWRDDVGYGVVADLRLPEEAAPARGAPRRSSDALGEPAAGIGETGTDSVLLRSFSALDLSILAALELQDPALDEAGYARLRRRRARLPERRTGPARARAAGRLDPRDRAHGRPAQVPGARRALHSRRTRCGSSKRPGRR